jgi:hypothetical protein
LASLAAGVAEDTADMVAIGDDNNFDYCVIKLNCLPFHDHGDVSVKARAQTTRKKKTDECNHLNRQAYLKWSLPIMAFA